MSVDDQSIGPKRIMVVGVGGGGCNAVDGMAVDWEQGPAVTAINTDMQALSGLKKATRQSIGEKITRGMGTGGDPTIGRLAAEDDFEKLRALCVAKDLVIVVTALGGGTGTGAAPVVARAAHETGALVIAFATLPFAFEGDHRMAQARQGVAELRDQADVVIVVPNQGLFAAAGGNATAEDAFRQADYILSMGVFAIWKLLTQRGLINIDFATLRVVARCSGGVSTFSYGEGRGFTRAEEAVQAALHSPLLESGPSLLAEAESVLISILGGPDMAIREVEAVMNAIRKVTRKDAHIFMGTAIDEHWRDTVSVTVVASQFWIDEDAAAGKPEVEPEGGDADKSAPTGKKKKRASAQQAQLGFEPVSKGIFKDVEPTYIEGEDMDIPTFMRRRIVIEK